MLLFGRVCLIVIMAEVHWVMCPQKWRNIVVIHFFCKDLIIFWVLLVLLYLIASYVSDDPNPFSPLSVWLRLDTSIKVGWAILSQMS